MASKTLQRFFTLLTITALFAATAAAASLSLDKHTIWIHKDVGDEVAITGNFNCNSTDPTISLIHNGEPLKGKTVSGDSFSYEIGTDLLKENTGDYKARLSCGNQENESFKVNHFQLKRVDTPAEVKAYKGSDVTFYLKALINGETVDLSPGEVELKTEFRTGEKLQSSPTNDKKLLRVDATIPEEGVSGQKSIFTGIKYKPGGFTVNTETPLMLDIKPTWQRKIVNKTPENGEIAYQNLKKLYVEALITRKGEKQNDLLPEDFYLKIKDMETENNTVIEKYMNNKVVGSTYLGPGTYGLKLNKIPELPLGRYKFIIGLNKNGGVNITEFQVSKYILFEGAITDAAGKSVDGQITFDKEGFSRRVDVKGGKYSANLLPGSYNFSISFPEARLSLKGVTLKESKNTVQNGVAVGNIRYDEIPIGEVSKSMEGVTVANAVAVWFGYPFEEGRMSLEYDTSKVNPSRLEVYECVGWNINGVSCYSGSKWKQVELQNSDIHPTVGRVTFPVSKYNATGSPILMNGYMVVKMTPLTLNSFELSSDRVEKGGNLNIQGKITTPSEQEVANAKVTVKILNSKNKPVKSKDFVTNGNGLFSGSITAPQKTGVYSFKVIAEKKPYSRYEKKLKTTFQTYTSKELTLQAPDTTQFYVGDVSRSELTVLNSGQSTIKDVKLSVNGFNNNWYNFTRQSWDKLKPGEAKKSVLNVELPSDYCSNSCNKYKTVKLEVTGQAGGKVNDLVSLQAQIMKDKPAQKKSSSKKQDSGGSLADSLPSGDFIKEQSDFNLVIGILTVFILVLATAIKKKKGDGRGGRGRDSYRSGGRGGSRGRTSSGVIDVEPKNSGPALDSESSSTNTVSEEEKQQGSGEENVCGECGESFDSSAALRIHKQNSH